MSKAITREILKRFGIEEPAPEMVDALEEMIDELAKCDFIEDRLDAELLTFQIITKNGENTPAEIIAKIEDLMQPIGAVGI